MVSICQGTFMHMSASIIGSVTACSAAMLIYSVPCEGACVHARRFAGGSDPAVGGVGRVEDEVDAADERTGVTGSDGACGSAGRFCTGTGGGGGALGGSFMLTLMASAVERSTL